MMGKLITYYTFKPMKIGLYWNNTICIGALDVYKMYQNSSHKTKIKSCQNELYSDYSKNSLT